jgi:hypothetical protein
MVGTNRLLAAREYKSNLCAKLLASFSNRPWPLFPTGAKKWLGFPYWIWRTYRDA